MNGATECWKNTQMPMCHYQTIQTLAHMQIPVLIPLIFVQMSLQQALHVLTEAAVVAVLVVVAIPVAIVRFRLSFVVEVYSTIWDSITMTTLAGECMFLFLPRVFHPLELRLYLM